MIAADGEDIEQLLLALRQAKAQLAVTRMRAQAAAKGLDRLSEEEIEAEVAAARRERQQ
jgi:hypothetical protein